MDLTDFFAGIKQLSQRLYTQRAMYWITITTTKTWIPNSKL